MANRVFELQASRCALGVQLLFFIVILTLLYPLLVLWLWLGCLGIMALTWWLWCKQPQVKAFEYLDDQEWSFEFVHSSLPIQRQKIDKIIDHQCYIVIYFTHHSPKSCVIWWDQLSRLQWKNLKVLAKLV